MQIISSDTKQDPSTQCIQCNLYHLPHLNQPKKYQTRSYKYFMSSCISTSWTAQLVNLISCTNHATCTVTWAGHIDFTHYLHQLRLINSPWRDKEALPPRWIVFPPCYCCCCCCCWCNRSHARSNSTANWSVLSFITMQFHFHFLSHQLFS